jgi:DNA alkylation repair enzyme
MLDIPARVLDLQNALDPLATPDGHAHRASTLFEVPTRGVKLPAIRVAVASWAAQFTSAATSAECRALTLALLAQTYLDDKLAGVMFASEACSGRGADGGVLFGPADLYLLDAPLCEGQVDNFVIVNTLADKILSPLLYEGGGARAETMPLLLQWCAGAATAPWRARVAIVAFSSAVYAKDGDLRGPIWDGCTAILGAGLNAATTAVGSVLKAVARPNADEEPTDEDLEDGRAFVWRMLLDMRYLRGFDRESLTKAIYHFNKEQKADVRERFKVACIASSVHAQRVPPVTGREGNIDLDAEGDEDGDWNDSVSGAAVGATPTGSVGGSGIGAPSAAFATGNEAGDAGGAGSSGASFTGSTDDVDLIPF